ncbi:MAG: VWA domain-containing protein [Leptolyngbya sp.]|nr:VWA domain-containing protein [Candidatus Melainabacteria bacterium]
MYIYIDTLPKLISNIVSSQHVIDTELSNGNLKVELAQAEELMNRDFVLKWTIAGETVKPSFLTYTDQQGESYCMLSLFSPKQEKFLGVPRDIIFVIDRSGSMEGLKMASAARSCSILLDTLGPRDRFAILAFDNINEWMNTGARKSESDIRFLTADEAGIEKGKDYLRTVTPRGGTELESALSESLSSLNSRINKDASGILVILTDGQIGDESGVLKCLQNDLQSSRLFAIGVDSAVNSGLLTRMAALGGGTAALVAPGAKLEKALLEIGREIGVPLVTDLRIESIEGDVIDQTITPAIFPDLFRGRAVTTFFKMKPDVNGKGKRKIRVSGLRADGKQFVEELSEKKISLSALAPLYAKSRIRDLEDAFREDRNRDHAKKQMIELSIQHQILCRFTAYLAIADGEVVNEDGALRSVVQPVQMPMSWGAPGASIGGGFYGSAKAGVGYPLSRSTGALDAAGAINNFSSGSDTWGGVTPPPPMPLSSGLPPAGPPPKPASPQQSNQWGSPISSRSNESKTGNLRADSNRERDAESAQKDKALVAATRHLLKLFDEIEEKFNAGQLLDWEILDSARLTCMTILQMSTYATRAAILQQFVRKEAIEIIAAIKANGLSKEHVETYSKIRDALKQCLDNIASGREPAITLGAPFWEDSI